MALTKSELIELVAEKQTQLSAKDVELAVKTMIEEMSQTLATGGRIEIRGFGSFSLHFREPRTGRNPKTGEAVDLQGKYVPHFKPGKELRDRVNSSMEEEVKTSGAIAEAGEGRPNIRQQSSPVEQDRSSESIPSESVATKSMSPPPSSVG
ncbi:MAG: integration host factor subunit beta [Pseudomonadales bacterium]|nr:integration host factor subunit beta [Pseudomonadales bacterium]